MGLACSQIRLLTLTRRKADCETGISIKSMEKMAITREQSELSQEYYSRLQAKQISYYANGKYNKVNYNYLMGYGTNFASIWNKDKYAMKEENSMILSDYNGRVVLGDSYAKAITDVLGAGAIDRNGRGGTFSTDNIAKILGALCPGYSAETFQKIIDEEELTSSYSATATNTLTGESTGKKVTVDNSATATEKAKAIVDFYYPIFAAAAANGFTTEYNKDMARNDDYCSDAISSGFFQLTTVNNAGEYDEGTSLTYFITAGMIQARTDSDAREEVQAWYENEKALISEKESMLDIEIDDLSTELEAINTEIQSVQSFIDDAISSVFDWGSA